jgi:hypothetical protein
MKPNITHQKKSEFCSFEKKILAQGKKDSPTPKPP